MKRLALKITDWVAFMIAASQLGRLWGTLFTYLFKGFLEDETFAENHPKKYLLGAMGIVLFAGLSGWLVVAMPLKWLFSKSIDKIDEFADDHEWD